MTSVQLPEVPAPCAVLERTWSATWFVGTDRLDHSIEQQAVYTADQLRAYATEAVMADRRLIAARVADLCAWLRSGNDIPADLPFVFRERWQKIVADIRAIEILTTQPEQNSGR